MTNEQHKTPEALAQRVAVAREIAEATVFVAGDFLWMQLIEDLNTEMMRLRALVDTLGGEDN